MDELDENVPKRVLWERLWRLALFRRTYQVDNILSKCLWNSQYLYFCTNKLNTSDILTVCMLAGTRINGGNGPFGDERQSTADIFCGPVRNKNDLSKPWMRKKRLDSLFSNKHTFCPEPSKLIRFTTSLQRRSKNEYTQVKTIRAQLGKVPSPNFIPTGQGQVNPIVDFPAQSLINTPTNQFHFPASKRWPPCVPIFRKIAVTYRKTSGTQCQHQKETWVEKSISPVVCSETKGRQSVNSNPSLLNTPWRKILYKSRLPPLSSRCIGQPEANKWHV